MLRAIGSIIRGLIVGGCLTALIFQILTTSSCNFLFRAPDDDPDVNLSFGLWYQGVNNACFEDTYGYDALDEDRDKFLDGARLCNVISVVSGVIAMALVAIECLKCKVICGTFLQHLAFVVAWANSFSVYMIFGMGSCGNYFVASDIQERFDEMNQVGLYVDGLDRNPDVDFQIDPAMAASIESNMNNTATDMVPAFVERIPFGTQCYWGEGASYNLIASLLYLACGILLCLAPTAKPLYGKPEPYEEDDVDLLIDNRTKTNLSMNALAINGEKEVI